MRAILWILLALGPAVVAAQQPAGSEFQVNTYTLYSQGRPAVAPDGASGFVVSWQSSDGNGDDTDGYRIQAQRYLGPNIFEDGFESGDTSAWSSVVP